MLQQFLIRRAHPEFGIQSGDVIVVDGDTVSLMRALSRRMDVAELLDAVAPSAEIVNSASTATARTILHDLARRIG